MICEKNPEIQQQLLGRISFVCVSVFFSTCCDSIDNLNAVEKKTDEKLVESRVLHKKYMNRAAIDADGDEEMR